MKHSRTESDGDLIRRYLAGSDNALKQLIEKMEADNEK